MSEFEEAKAVADPEVEVSFPRHCEEHPHKEDALNTTALEMLWFVTWLCLGLGLECGEVRRPEQDQGPLETMNRPRATGTDMYLCAA